MERTPGLKINRYNDASISSKAYNKGLTPDNLKISFRKTGIYPLERKQISKIRTVPSTFYEHVDDDTKSELNTSTDKGSTFPDSQKISKVSENP